MAHQDAAAAQIGAKQTLNRYGNHQCPVCKHIWPIPFAGRQGVPQTCPLHEAAPDLLAALNRCGQLFREIRDDFEDPRHECREGVRIIEAAIAKAQEAQP